MSSTETEESIPPQSLHDRAGRQPDRFERSLEDEIQFVRGVGPVAAELFNRLGIVTVWDLLRHVPRGYQDRRTITPLRNLKAGEFAAVEGRIIDVENEIVGKNRLNLTRVVIRDSAASAFLVFFQRPYLAATFATLRARGAAVHCYGKPKQSMGGGWTFENPEWEETEAGPARLDARRLVPVYTVTEGLSQFRMRRIIHAALTTYSELVEDICPERARERLNAGTLRQAIRDIHYPENEESLERARRTLSLSEFLPFQVHLVRRNRKDIVASAVPRIAVAEGYQEQLRALLPHEPNAGQWAAIEAIAADLSSVRPMDRLLQGDVGSGKTLVAAAALALCAKAGWQGAFMAPTEVLARQQFATLQSLFRGSDICVWLATGSLSSAEKEQVRAASASGEAHLLVGTHALQMEGFEFAKLGLAVIDEQHRFGVKQRRALRAKGVVLHVLSISATPIPRTLVLSLYGETDVSELREVLPGRQPVKTHWKTRDKAGKVYAGVRSLLAEGRQAFVVCPAIEADENWSVQAAADLANRLRERDLRGFRVGLVHGRLQPGECDRTIAAFRAGEIDALVSTTVIEVGIDVPNACVMVVEDADRFGLAQLHQLRGRVGRGSGRSYCVLLADPATPEAEERLRLMTTVADGFRLAEEDLRLRGPGEVLGTRQSGIPEFRFGNLVRNEALMRAAREAAEEIVAADPELSHAEHRRLAAWAAVWAAGSIESGRD